MGLKHGITLAAPLFPNARQSSGTDAYLPQDPIKVGGPAIPCHHARRTASFQSSAPPIPPDSINGGGIETSHSFFLIKVITTLVFAANGDFSSPSQHSDLLGVCMIRTFIWFCRPNPTFYININRVHKWRAGSCEGLHKYTNWSAYTSYCHCYFKFQQEKATPTPSSSWDMAALLPPATISHHHPNTDSRHYCIPRKNWNKFFVILHKYISFERNI